MTFVSRSLLAALIVTALVACRNRAADSADAAPLDAFGDTGAHRASIASGAMDASAEFNGIAVVPLPSIVSSAPVPDDGFRYSFTGTASMEKVTEWVDVMAPDLRRCFRLEQKRDPNVADDVVVRVSVGPSGKVVSCTMESLTGIAKCASAAIDGRLPPDHALGQPWTHEFTIRIPKQP